ncbi:hypothetical protein RchiOBHm_Chr2g0111471 [Rosa chinensis]|uniref:DUF4220 domain-containing protein n=1 Tax=Rosa chinensis TaxID=74649 RepID=A0A2P6RPY1_ROSCH|nr:uncharacterized protein LOC112183939 [Rosa chinensis]PRQ48506.1 hypothetical protein RchiOBHm_Chr2g0111471 [Rosa chinensis]
MEDNALWPRHFLGLIFQVLAVTYVFIMQSTRENKLWWPTLLLIFPGLVKYGERTRALYLASLSSLKDSILAVPDTGPDYAKYMDEYSSRKAANLPIHIHTETGRGPESKSETYPEEEAGGDKIDNIVVVRLAHEFFKISMGLIIDIVLDFHQRKQSRAYFDKRTSEAAYTLIATELNFMYEALYTKAYVVHYVWGYVLRAISFGTVCIALGFFYKLDKHGFHRFDVRNTYSLLLGAIALDSIAISMLILSDWTVVISKCRPNSCLATNLMNKHLNLKRSLWSTTEIPTKCLEGTRKILFQRWSESVSAFSFIDYSLHEYGRAPPTVMDYAGFLGIKIIRFMGLKDIRDEIKYRTSKKLSGELWKFIFEELKSKSEDAVDPQNGSKICSARGEWILKEYYYGDGGPLFNNLRSRIYLAGEWILKEYYYVTYDRSILLWHIATELRYHDEKPQNSNAGDHKNSNAGGDDGDHREFSKTLSDYMLYLLVMQPDLMSSVAGIGQKRFSDTFAEAKQFFEKRALGSDETLENACRKLLEVNTEIKPVDVKGNRSKSVLFDACILARELKNLRWKFISEVWVELLSYAASHCRPSSHAQLLSKGGELVTFVWLLMAHFGIAEQFQVQEDQARVKLTVGKPADEVFYWSGEKPPESKATGSIQ